MTLEEIKARWNEVLDEILRHDRILWLALFDGRLAQFTEGQLTIDFFDPEKFAGDHNFTYLRDVSRIKKVEMIAQNILGLPISITINSGR